MSQFLVPSDMTLLQALEHFYPESSKRTLLQWMKNERVLVDETAIKRGDTLLKGGQSLKVLPKEVLQIIEGIKVLFVDRWMVAIDKPTGLLSVPLDNTSDKPHALGLLRAHYGASAIFPVHRIDRETSGVLLFARGKASEEKFDHLFAEHLLEREYFAIVEGKMAKDKGTWISHLLEKENYDVIQTTPDQGKLAITHYEVIRRSKNFTYLRLRLETGRKHQIRVHCKEAGHPVVGDKRYGALTNPIKRLGLHAHALRFIHPFTGKKMEFVSPMPKAFLKLGAS